MKEGARPTLSQGRRLEEQSAKLAKDSAALASRSWELTALSRTLRSRMSLIIASRREPGRRTSELD
jgi:hypothetical protein